MFSKLAIAKRTWSPRGVHYTTDYEDYYTPYRCAIVSVNSQMGLVDAEIYHKAVDHTVFVAYIERLSICMGGQPFYLFMDQLSVHKNGLCREKMDEHGITPIFNCAASPE